MKLASYFRIALVAAVAVFADVLQGGSIVASNTSLDANDPTKGNVAGLGSSEFGLGQAPNPTAPSTYGSDVNIIRMMNNPFIVGDSFYNGTLKIENDTTVSFQHGGKNPAGDGRTEGLTVMGDLLRADNNVTVLFESLVPSAEYSMPRQYKDLNYIYVDGKIEMGNSQFKMGTDHVNPINLYAGSIFMGTDSDSFVNWSGDIYLHDPNGVSKFMVGKSGMSLVQFISNNIERPNVLGNYMGSNIFCNNKELMIIGCGSDSNVSIGGDIIMSNPQGHLIIDLSDNYQSLVVGGSVVCAGRLTIKISNMHNFKAIGGIYVDPSKVTFDVNNGKINDVAYNGSGAAFVRAYFAIGYTMQHKTTYGGVDNTISHKDSETAAFGTFTNTGTYAYIQSLGVEATGTTTYDDTFKRIRTNARARGYPKNEAEDGTWTSQYLADLASKIGNGYENYDYSLYPYCGRWDEIFEKYVRWDCHQTSDGFGYDNAMKESEAAGHTYVNYQPIAGGDTFRACAPTLTDSAFIPVRVYGAGGLEAGVDYFNSKAHFSPYPESYSWPSAAYKEVTIGTHKGDGSYYMPKKSFFVVEDSCVINLAEINANSDENKKRFNIFINPEGKSSPINIVFCGRVAGDEMVNVVINNTVKYDVSGGSFDYTNASYDKTYTKLKADPGREQVRIFFEKGSGVTGGGMFNIYCTGAYGQFNEGAIHAIGSPYYPGYADYIAQYGDIDSVTPTSIDAYAHELIPNVRVYAESGSALECASQFFVNAEILMPEGSILTGTNKIQHKVYFKEYPSSEEVYVENKYLFVLGSSCVKALRANDAQGIVVCLEDQFRDKFTVPPPPVVSNVVARQRWPWNGLVDVDYEIGGYTAGLKVEIEFDEQGGLSRHWVATNFIADAEPTLNRGHNRATWDAKAAGVTNVIATNVIAIVSLLRMPIVDIASGMYADAFSEVDFTTPNESNYFINEDTLEAYRVPTENSKGDVQTIASLLKDVFGKNDLSTYSGFKYANGNLSLYKSFTHLQGTDDTVSTETFEKAFAVTSAMADTDFKQFAGLCEDVQDYINNGGSYDKLTFKYKSDGTATLTQSINIDKTKSLNTGDLTIANQEEAILSMLAKFESGYTIGNSNASDISYKDIAEVAGSTADQVNSNSRVFTQDEINAANAIKTAIDNLYETIDQADKNTANPDSFKLVSISGDDGLIIKYTSTETEERSFPEASSTRSATYKRVADAVLTANDYTNGYVINGSAPAYVFKNKDMYGKSYYVENDNLEQTFKGDVAKTVNFLKAVYPDETRNITFDSSAEYTMKIEQNGTIKLSHNGLEE